ncbi:SDR family oxidoreductase [Pimelobacter simplex]|uniref:20-beta-hydroxysteroid dehydrogenase n=1 Tax=Nocardioides simplex TaxID=2045 RepID=A0A0A1DN86_NOCSI|nr:SDR family oxidoreductase [Pimelobacter simplex]AIY18834.1 20-beta-hydroxysteroid dehydrogenase [Pimelobacter simplex]MCG8152435.1 SDR family oxidoreductase [Pimelobacter simplex]GEB14549.1 oxidoreductase [Pimelobacter simplex]SFM28357.1 NADP-dependent 3-hydroxy acid dehydrogenase YdfG [Pimelobacter simplex]
MTGPAGRLAGKVAVVTGGASGIGAGTVRAFHAEGARVVVADVQAEAGAALVAELGERTLFHRTDVRDEASVRDLVDTAVAHFGRLDIMFNNAGIIGAVGPIDRTRMDDADLTVAVNLRGVLLGMKHAARVMKPQGSGVIISTSSPAGVMGGVGAHVYSAVKAGVIGLSNSVAAELRPYGVRANVVIPGAVVSAMTADLVAGGAADLDGAAAALDRSRYMGRPLQPADVAAGVVYLASDDAALVTGVVLPIDAGMTGAGGPSPMADDKYADQAGRREAGRRVGDPDPQEV